MPRPVFRPKWIRSRGRIHCVFSYTSLPHLFILAFTVNDYHVSITVQNAGNISVNKIFKKLLTCSAFWAKNKMARESVLLVYSSGMYYHNKIIRPCWGKSTIYCALNYSYFQWVLWSSYRDVSLRKGAIFK